MFKSNKMWLFLLSIFIVGFLLNPVNVFATKWDAETKTIRLEADRDNDYTTSSNHWMRQKGYCGVVENLVIDAGVSYVSPAIIPGSVFSDGVERNCYSNLKTITIRGDTSSETASAFTINADTFKGVTTLESLTIYDRSKKITIGNNAFQGTSIKSLQLNNTIKKIGNDAFADTLSLEEVYIDGVDSIGNRAFSQYSNRPDSSVTESALKKVTILNMDGKSVGNQIFQNAINLEEVILENSPIQTKIFYGCRSLKTLVIPDTVTTISKEAFNWSGLENIVIPKTVTNISDNAFSNSKNLDMVIFQGINTPVFGNNPFSGGNPNIYVPYQSVKNYKTELDGYTIKPIFLDAIKISSLVHVNLHGTKNVTVTFVPEDYELDDKYNVEDYEDGALPQPAKDLIWSTNDSSIASVTNDSGSNNTTITVVGNNIGRTYLVAKLKDDPDNIYAMTEVAVDIFGIDEVDNGTIKLCNTINGSDNNSVFQYKITGPNGFESSVLLTGNNCKNIKVLPGKYKVKQVLPQGYVLNNVSGVVSSDNIEFTVSKDNVYDVKYTSNKSSNNFLKSFGYSINSVPATATISIITFNANGGSGTMSSIRTTVGSMVSLTDNDFVLEGYKLANWIDADGNTYEDGAVSNEIATKQNVELTASWEPIEYTVVFDSNGADMESVKQTFKYDEEKKLKNNTFERAGYTFDGWIDSSSNTYSNQELVKNLSSIDKSNVILKAKWIVNQYTITFDGNGGTDIDSITGDFGSPIGDLEDSVLDGMIFLGWYTEKEGGE